MQKLSPFRPQSREKLASLLLAFSAWLAVSNVNAAAPKSKLSEMKIPAHKAFIDTVGTIVLPDDPGDMQERFTDSPRRVPGSATIVGGPAVEPFIASMTEDLNEFIEYYSDRTKNPVPPYSHIPIYIVDSTDINCQVVREDYDEAGKTASTGLLGFLDTTPTQTSKATIGAGKPSEASGSESAAHLELTCTNEALYQIGGEHFGQRDSLGHSEIAFILGHELSHILLGHFKLQEAQAKQQKELNSLFKIGSIVITLMNSKYNRVGQTVYVNPTPEASKNVTRLLLAAYAINEFNVAIMAPKWAREQERQADIMSIDMMEGINSRGRNSIWNTEGSIAYLDRVSKLEKERAKKDNFASQLAAALADSTLSGVSRGQSGKSLINGLATQAAILAYIHYRDNNLAHLHDYADIREATIGDYLDYRNNDPFITPQLASANSSMPGAAQMPGSSQLPGSGQLPGAPLPEGDKQSVAPSAPAYATPAVPAKPDQYFPDPNKMYAGDLWNGAYEKAVAPQIKADAIVQEMSRNGCETLSEEQLAFLSDEEKNIPPTQIENFAVGAYYACKFKWPQAIPFLKAATHGEQHFSAYYLALIQAEQISGDYESSLPELEEAEATTKPRNQYLPLHIKSLFALKKLDEADKMALECKAHEDLDVGTACMASEDKTYEGAPLPKETDADTQPQPGSDTSPVNFLKNLLGSGKTTTKSQAPSSTPTSPSASSSGS